MSQPVWIIMPVLAGPEMTEAAISDCLAQSVPTRILVINQGVDDDFRYRLERIAEAESDRIFLWSHEPPLPSLSASWNRALDFVWESGGEEALVVNNDVRLHRETVDHLVTTLDREGALFVTAVGVTAEQFDPSASHLFPLGTPRGGPDFSCFLISRECHDRYRFDEQFIPAFCEDLDTHRRIMLANEGSRIFSVNLPYLHLSSQTLKSVDPQQRKKIEAQIGAGSRAYYAKKWGGPVNQETFYHPFAGASGVYIVGEEAERNADWAARCGPTTPELQRWVAGPPIEELCRKMLSLEDVGVTPQPPAPGDELPKLDKDIPF